MKNKRVFTLLSITVIFVFITSLFTTINVLADDATPPAPTEEPALPPTEEPVAATEEPVATEEHISITEQPVATEVPAEEDVNVSEIMTQVPEGTDLVVLDQNGDVLPLVSSEAAEVLASADPYYWDGTNYIGFSSSGICPPIVTVCNTNANPIQAAVDDFATNSTATGNIYVEAGTYTENVVVDGSLSIYLANLTGIIGDGSGSTTLEGSFEIYNMNAFTLSGFSVVDNGSGGGYVYAFDNTGAFTLNDLIVSNPNGNGPTGDGIDVVSHDGDINLTNVISSDNYYSGAVLENCGVCGALGDITVSSSTFDNNGMASEQSTARGLRAWSNGSITLTDVAADWNAGGGAELINCFFDFFGGTDTCLNTNPAAATITVNGTNTFNNNGYIPDQFFGGPDASVGLWVGSKDGATISGVTASQNGMGDIAGGALFFAENGNLSISNSIFNENCMDCGLGFGFVALNLGGDTTLNGVTANDTGNQAFSTPLEGVGGIIFNLSGNTTVNDSDFSNNCNLDDCSGGGVLLLSAGDVALDHVTANSNGTYLGGGGGASIEAEGNVVVTNGGFSNNQGRGLDVLSYDGNITLNNVIANGNYNSGAWLDNTDGSGDIRVLNSSFDGNVQDDEEPGLNVDSNGFVTLSGVSASNNGGDGADIGDQSGSFSGVLVENSVFNNNAGVDDEWGWGLYIYNGSGDVSIQNVTALNNLYNGLYVDTSENVLINLSVFSSSLDDDGAEFNVDGNVDIYCSTFSNNSNYGVDGSSIGGILTLNDVIFGGNGDGDYSGTAVINSGLCKKTSPFVEPTAAGLPFTLNVVNAESGRSVELDCTNFRGTQMILPNGDNAIFPCPLQDTGSLKSATKDSLPGDLPAGNTFGSGLSTQLIKDGKEQTTIDPAIIVSFKIPEDLKDANLAILFWDGAKWVEVEGLATGDGQFQASVNFTGTFVLVSK